MAGHAISQPDLPPTSGVDLLTVAFAALTDEEQVEALARLQGAHLRRVAGEEGEMARMLASLSRAVEVLGHVPSPAEYKSVRERLAEEGTDLEPFAKVLRHFGTWRLAKEAISLSETTTARLIETRFASRRIGKVWRYTDETLRETLDRAVAAIGHVPQVAEFDWWRQRELELARARGETNLHLPSATPYRKRWGTWEAALAHFGFSPEEIAARLERT